MIEIKNALISVHDKEGLVEFSRQLRNFNIEIFATSGTSKMLEQNHVQNTGIEDLTGAHEILDGRVKTLQPAIFGAILANRHVSEHMSTLKTIGIKPIDLVVVNLYPFEEGVSRNLDENEMIELIDIGGVALIRAAAKNYTHVISVSSPEQYSDLIDELRANEGKVSISYSLKSARDSFRRTFHYDRIISNYLSQTLKEEELKFPEILAINMKKIKELNYGENPHQSASIYAAPGEPRKLLSIKSISGKNVFYNTWLNLDSALSVLKEFEIPASVIIKNCSPCAVGTGKNIYDAFSKSFITDPVSSRGGVIATNREIDFQTANDITGGVFSAVIAPSYEKEALNSLSRQKNIRLLQAPESLFKPDSDSTELRSIKGGILVQEENDIRGYPDEWEVVSDREPSDKEKRALSFAFKVSKWVKSNGTVISTVDRTIGIGSGQPSRIDSVQLAIKKAGNQGHYTGGTVMACDGILPFRDSIDEASEAGISAVIEPGGSIRDRRVIEAANEYDIALLFTGKQNLRH